MTAQLETLAVETGLTSRERPTLRAWYALAILIIAVLFGASDRQILVLVTEPLKHDMRLSDVQIGLLQGLGPGLFGAIGSFALGWLADRYARQTILAVCILAWSAATAACGLAQTFGQLFAATIAIALGETALGPVFYSMTPDLFPGQSRNLANNIAFGAVTIGAGFGIALGGGALSWVEAHRTVLPLSLRQLAAWRLVFFALAVPGVAVAAAVLAIGPVRRVMSRPAQKIEGSIRGYLHQHWRVVGGLFLATSLCLIANYAGYAWTPVYIVRVLGAAPADVGEAIGVALTAGSVVGVCMAAMGARLLTPRLGAMTPVRLYQGAMAASLIPVVLQLLVEHPWQAYVLVAIQTASTMAGNALMPTLLQDIAPAAIRARVIALSVAFTYAVVAVAPVVVGVASDALVRFPRGLLWSLVLVSAPAIAAGVLLLLAIDAPLRRTIQAFSPGQPPLPRT